MKQYIHTIAALLITIGTMLPVGMVSARTLEEDIATMSKYIDDREATAERAREWDAMATKCAADVARNWPEVPDVRNMCGGRDMTADGFDREYLKGRFEMQFRSAGIYIKDHKEGTVISPNLVITSLEEIDRYNNAVNLIVNEFYRASDPQGEDVSSRFSFEIHENEDPAKDPDDLQREDASAIDIGVHRMVRSWMRGDYRTDLCQVLSGCSHAATGKQDDMIRLLQSFKDDGVKFRMKSGAVVSPGDAAYDMMATAVFEITWKDANTGRSDGGYDLSGLQKLGYDVFI